MDENVKRTIRRGVGRLFTLLVILLVAAFLTYVGPDPSAGSTTMLLGFLLLGAFVAGELAREFGLPRITGYLVIGALFGPYVSGLLPQETVIDFRLINGVALSVIALQAGGELRIKRVRERLRSILSITAFQILVTLTGIVAIVWLARDLFPFLVDQPARSTLAIALIFAVVAVAKSPATTIAVITEVHARGPVTDTVLGVSVVKDVIVLLMIAAVVPAAAVIADPARSFDFAALQEISIAMGWSLLFGAAVGAVTAAYLEKVNRQPVLFLLGLAFLIVELSQALHLEYILVSMTAGFIVQNYSGRGPGFLEALEANSLPLYAVFFAVAGADLNMSVIPEVWRVGLVIVLARILLIYLSTTLGTLVAGDLPVIRRYAWMGFMAKAGVTLGLANIVRDRFTPWGDEVAAIIIAMIAVNQLLGPPLFRFALDAAGESRSQSLREPSIVPVP